MLFKYQTSKLHEINQTLYLSPDHLKTWRLSGNLQRSSYWLSRLIRFNQSNRSSPTLALAIRECNGPIAAFAAVDWLRAVRRAGCSPWGLWALKFQLFRTPAAPASSCQSRRINDHLWLLMTNEQRVAPSVDCLEQLRQIKNKHPLYLVSQSGSVITL